MLQVYASCNPDLGVPLARWVEKNIVDELTEGRHALLRATASGLASMQHLREPPVPATLPLATLFPAMPLPTAQSSPPLPTHTLPASTSTSTSLPSPPVASALPPRTNTPPPPSVLSQLPASLNAYPILTKVATTLLHIKTHKIDMSALIKAPGELFLSEEAWIGRDVIMARLKKSQSDLGSDVNSNMNTATNSSELEGSEELNRVLEGVAELVREMNVKIGGGGRERNGADAEEDKRAAKRRKLDSFSGHVSPDDVFPNPNFTPASIQATAAAATINGNRNGSGNGHANARAFAMKQEKEAKHRLAASPASPATPDTAEMSAATTPAPTPISTTFTASSSPAPTSPMSPSPSTPTAEPGVEEGPELRHLRLNLLALAKRAPLDTIAKLPKDLVPEHIRQYVPTLGV